MKPIVGGVRPYAVPYRHRRHGFACGPGTRRLGRLCGRRSVEVADWPQPEANGSESLLRHDRRGYVDRVGLNFTPINPIEALYWSAVINGVVAVPVIVIMMLMQPSHASWEPRRSEFLYKLRLDYRLVNGGGGGGDDPYELFLNGPCQYSARGKPRFPTRMPLACDAQ